MSIGMLVLLLSSCSQPQVVPSSTLQSTGLSASPASPTVATIPTTTSTPAPTPTPIPPWPVLANTPVPQSGAVISIENVDRVVQLARWGKGTVRQALPSPDGKLLAVASSLGVYLYDAETLEEMGFIEVVRAHSLAFSPDGDILAVASTGGTIELWQMSDRTQLRTLDGHEDWIGGIAFSPEGSVLASASWDKTVRLWQVEDGTILRVIEEPSRATKVSFSPNGSVLAWGREDGMLLLLDLDDEDAQPRALEEHEFMVVGIAFSPDSQSVISGGSDGTLVFRNVGDGAIYKGLKADLLHSLALSPDGSALALGTYTGQVRVAQAADDPMQVETLEGHAGPVESVAFLPDGTLVSGSRDGTVRFWQRGGSVPSRTLAQHAGYMWCLAFSSDGQMLAAGSEDSSTRLWSVRDGTVLHRVGGETFTFGVTSVAFSPDGATLASGDGDGNISLWSTSDGTLVRTLHKDESWAVKSLAFSADGQTLVSGARDAEILLWQISGGSDPQVLTRLGTERQSTTAVAPDGTAWALVWKDGSVDIWREAGSKPVGPAGDGETVTGMAFSPDGNMLAIGLEGGSADIAGGVLLWSVDTDEFSGYLETGNPVQSIAFSPNGKLLASGGNDGTVQLWGIGELVDD
jgi:WD40 repeat protein